MPMSLYGAEPWGMRSAERRNVNVLEMKCLRSLVGVSRGLGTLTSVFYSSEMSSQSKGRGEGKASSIPKYWCF